MRGRVEGESVRRLMSLLARHARAPGRIYLTGGACAVLLGWRATTIDVDLKLDPEPPGVFEAIRRAKEDLGINIELAAPDDFIPPLPGWRERSQAIEQVGGIEFLHYDFYAQALAKIERGHRQDVEDVATMFRRGLVEATELLRLFEQIIPALDRYPAIDAQAFRQKVEAAIGQAGGAGDR